MDPPTADRSDFQLALGRGYQLAGDQTKAAAEFRAIFRNQPVSNEAVQSLAQLQGMGMGPSAAERKVRADALFNAKHYGEAEAEYRAIKGDSSLSQADRDALQIYSAVCDLKLKHLGRKEAENLPTTSDDSAALKLYLLAEISRTEKDRVGHDALIAQMVQKFPQSRWTEEALYSGGNMYLLTHDAEQAIYHYKLLVDHFPTSIYAPSAHWRVAWMDYRLRRYTDAAPLMDEQITRYGAGIEASSALYWRGRIYEDESHDFGQAANYYRAIVANYPNYYYGYLAKERLKMLGSQTSVAPAAPLASVRKLVVPDLASVVPQDDPHLIKAKLLANAALNEYIGQEIAAGQGSAAVGRAGAGADLCLVWRDYAFAAVDEEVGHLVFRAAHESGSERILAAYLPATVLGRSDERCDEERSRPISGCLADPAGVRIQRRGGKSGARLRANATAAIRRQGERQARGDEGLPDRVAVESDGQSAAGHAQSEAGARSLRRPARVRARGLQRWRRARAAVDGQR